MNARNAPRHGQSDNEFDGLDDADVADLWVMDPDTGNYQLRSPGPAAPAPRRGEPDDDDPFASLYRDSAGSAGGSRARTVAPQRSEPDVEPRTSRRTAAAAAPPPRSKAKKRLKWTAIGLAVVLVVIAGAAYGYYWYLNNRIKKTERSGANEVPKAAADEFGRVPLNILLIGSDTRVGEGNTGYGDKGHEGLADTTILMHLSADRSNATMVSIPRDTMVDRPSCKYDKGVQPASTNKVQFNTTLRAPGGAPCTVATVERMLGVQVDHYLMIDFKGVKEMTKAVDGVPINLCEPINDPVRPNKQGGTGLKLPAGPQRLEGNDALQFLRARHAFGDGSDLARIEAQKSFLMALAREIKTSATWKDPAAVIGIAQAATGNLQVDKGLGSINKLVGLGNEIKKVPEKRMAFTTLPIEPYPGNPEAWVQQRQPDANKLWEALRTDTAVTKGDPAAPVPGAAPETPVAAPPAPPTVDPSTVRVTVRNTTKYPKAKAVATQLTELKYKATADTANSGTPRDNSVVKYPKGKADTAKQIAAAVGMSPLAIEESTAAGSTFELVIGSDFPGLTGAAPTKGTTAGAPGTTAASAPPIAVPPAEELKLNTADNTSCISTGKKR
ncbi:LCP family protein [Yinghuangia soli]|uniref:LCP family protein n=1 Tax=Yinghuangia soli TaxID=2908204 RepID=A0AA41Q6W3_9ACTN|nr:LCP family protein [Yinghuangia soli]MCF2532684.1 LCP family protein [Yinghuangia soli]